MKTFRDAGPAYLLPERNTVTMAAPFMQAYSDLLVRTCHRRGAYAIGGMAAFIPSRRDAEVNAAALAKVRADKTREADAGYEGSWVAHPIWCRSAARSSTPHSASVQPARRALPAVTSPQPTCSTSPVSPGR